MYRVAALASATSRTFRPDPGTNNSLLVEQGKSPALNLQGARGLAPLYPHGPIFRMLEGNHIQLKLKGITVFH